MYTVLWDADNRADFPTMATALDFIESKFGPHFITESVVEELGIIGIVLINA